MLVGAGAPGAGKWPLRLGAGARWRLTESARVEVMAEANASGRPAQGMGLPLAPVPPRLGVLAELVMALGAPPRVLAPPPTPPPPPVERPVPLVLVDLGTIQLPEGARITLRQRGEERDFAQGENGRFSLTDARPGPGTVVASAPGYRSRTESVNFRAGEPATVTMVLERDLPSGQVRGTVRSFDGRPLTANVRLVPRQAGPADDTPSEKRSEGGAFTFDVPPGRYRVTIGAPGHEPQTRMVEVEENGVTVLNADLRRQR
jgi:hypothetical protein